MSESNNINKCPVCGAENANAATEGLCAACLLQQAALESEIGTPKSNDPTPTIEEVATAFPQLEILEKIGRGGMGTVFKARQPKLDRFVALKILSSELAEKATFADRFAREGKLLARLNHPNIVAVYDFGESGGFYYLLMEYVDGVNLRQAMREERFTAEQAIAIVPKICEALQYAHDEGVLHRDIKPENILLDVKGRVKIADFGIAAVRTPNANGSERLTQTGQILGTPSYMAPEQLNDPDRVDHRADIYSLGVVFYELLTGELPQGRFPLPSEKTPVGANVDEIVLKALEKEREKRQQSAEEMKSEIETANKTQSKNENSEDLNVKADFSLKSIWKRIVNEVKTWPIWAIILVCCAVIFVTPTLLMTLLVLVYVVGLIVIGIPVLLFGDTFELLFHSVFMQASLPEQIAIVAVLLVVLSYFTVKCYKKWCNWRHGIKTDSQSRGGKKPNRRFAVWGLVLLIVAVALPWIPLTELAQIRDNKIFALRTQYGIQQNEFIQQEKKWEEHNSEIMKKLSEHKENLEGEQLLDAEKTLHAESEYAQKQREREARKYLAAMESNSKRQNEIATNFHTVVYAFFIFSGIIAALGTIFGWVHLARIRHSLKKNDFWLGLFVALIALVPAIWCGIQYLFLGPYDRSFHSVMHTIGNITAIVVTLYLIVKTYHWASEFAPLQPVLENGVVVNNGEKPKPATELQSGNAEKMKTEIETAAQPRVGKKPNRRLAAWGLVLLIVAVAFPWVPSEIVVQMRIDKMLALQTQYDIQQEMLIQQEEKWNNYRSDLHEKLSEHQKNLEGEQLLEAEKTLRAESEYVQKQQEKEIQKYSAAMDKIRLKKNEISTNFTTAIYAFFIFSGIIAAIGTIFGWVHLARIRHSPEKNGFWLALFVALVALVPAIWCGIQYLFLGPYDPPIRGVMSTIGNTTAIVVPLYLIARTYRWASAP